MLITAVRASWLRAPIPADRAHVSDFGKNDSFNMCLVEVETDTGLVGLGEAKAAGREPRQLRGHRRPDPRGAGAAPDRPRPARHHRDLGALLQRLARALRDARGANLPDHRPAGHHALRDQRHRHRPLGPARSVADVPVWRLLGGRYRERVPAYASGGWAPVGGIGTQLAQYVERGHRAVKLRVGLQDRSVSDSAARVREVRETLGPDIGIMVDAHGTWSVREAQRFARKVESDDLAWLEEPVSPDNLEGQAEVRRLHRYPDRRGESEQTRFAFREMIDARAVDICQPDPAIAGGITETQRICALAAASGLTVARTCGARPFSSRPGCT
jgi:L-alanine-DL-glutamate epimerase-like enolase superfamily enzyme